LSQLLGTARGRARELKLQPPSPLVQPQVACKNS
jgi:hypothetical protein